MAARRGGPTAPRESVSRTPSEGSARRIGPKALPLNLLSRLPLVKSRREMRKVRAARPLQIAAVALLAAASLTAGQQEVFEKAYSMEGIAKVSVENVNGHIDAVAWEKPYFKIKAIKT